MPPAQKPDAEPIAVEARCVRLLAKADDPASLAPTMERRTLGCQ
jgi:NADPH2:quinone reductase